MYKWVQDGNTQDTVPSVRGPRGLPKSCLDFCAKAGAAAAAPLPKPAGRR